MSQPVSMNTVRPITIVIAPSGKWYFSNKHYSPAEHLVPISMHKSTIHEVVEEYGRDNFIATPNAADEPEWVYDVYALLGMI